SVFFFFQAEDGIRDRNVTGVQTCALPICDLKKSVTELKTALNYFLTSKPNQKMIRDAMIVEKEGYATIPIKANYKNQLSGTIVAVSNGGQTVYFQPANVVRLNQQITNLKA